MLIKFSIENWMSYRDKTEVSMVATKEQHFGDRVARVKRLQTRILPIAMLFGGNASGKSNLFHALDFAKFLVTRGNIMPPNAEIPVEPFLLDAESRNKPSSFSFSILVGDDAFDYSFSVTRERILEEKLRRTTSPAKDFSFSRVYNPESLAYEMQYGLALQKDNLLLDLIARSTRANQLFLLSAVMQNVGEFLPVYHWFNSTLQLISPTSKYMPKELYADKSAPSFTRINELLAGFDTGIHHIERKPIAMSAIPLPEPFVADIARGIVEGGMVHLEAQGKTLPFILSRKDGKIIAEKLVACHIVHGMTHDEEFEIENESDGTKRILDLLPAFADMGNEGTQRVYVIDEIDRCLHTRATQKLLNTFLSTCGAPSRSQLLATTHDLCLMSQSILRRDEMWLVERSKDEVSELVPISDFVDARKDTDLRRSYLVGRMGGLPDIPIY